EACHSLSPPTHGLSYFPLCKRASRGWGGRITRDVGLDVGDLLARLIVYAFDLGPLQRARCRVLSLWGGIRHLFDSVEFWSRRHPQSVSRPQLCPFTSASRADLVTSGHRVWCGGVATGPAAPAPIDGALRAQD